MLVMGDFSGRESRAERTTQNAWRPTRVDRDNLTTLPGTLHVELRCPLPGDDASSLTLRFAELDDFHPDQLVHQVEPLQKLFELRERLNNPATSAGAVGELRVLLGSGEPPVETQSTAVTSPPSQSGRTSALATGLLDDILNKAATSASCLHPSEWQSFLRSIVKSHLAPREHPLAPDLVDQIDAAMSGMLRALLHHPSFQRLESSWRGLSFLVNRLETDTQLQLYLLDLTRAEFASDLINGNGECDSRLHRLLVEDATHTPEVKPWGVIGAVYTFDRTTEDMNLLGRMARISEEAGAPFVAAASPAIAGCPSFETTPDPDDWQKIPIAGEIQQQWQQLRRSAEAAYIGLALPRLLLRMPYGRGTDPITACKFEEMEGGPGHEHYCWVNPMFSCLLLLGQTFSADGWQLRPGSIQDLEGLPLHVYQDGTGDSVAKACAETWLTEQAAERLLDQGLMPLLSYKNQDRIRLMRFQSIALPSTPLQGRWNHIIYPDQ
jgi:type VI secretion system protein ImpC